MTEQDTGLTREELEEQNGEQLPPREVMSVIDPDPSQLAVPLPPSSDGTIPIDDPRPGPD
jgi:hypothetical protein